MLAVANRDGYPAASVTAVIAHAGVSRPTFYEHFPNRLDCFLALHGELSEELIARVRRAVEAQPAEPPLKLALTAICEWATARPPHAQLLLNQTIAAGTPALDARDRTLRQLEKIVERAQACVPAAQPSPDLPTRAALGALYWMLAPRVRRREHDPRLAGELQAWLTRYERPPGEHRWRTLAPGPLPPPAAHVSPLPAAPPPPIPPGRTRLPPEEIARNQRERILHAAALLAAEKGVGATTITDITGAAHLDRRVFYTHHPNKQHAFLAAHELAFQHTLANAAAAYFSAPEWPERVWRCILANTHYCATHPALAHLAYVESHALGPPAVQRFEDSRQAFTLFLQEGHSHTHGPHTPTETKPHSPFPALAPSPAGALPPLALEAIAAAIAEIGYHQARAGLLEELPRLAPHATYLCLAPFLGPTAAEEFIAAKLPAG
jgi:AcrR family transcriptional regulator